MAHIKLSTIVDPRVIMENDQYLDLSKVAARLEITKAKLRQLTKQGSFSTVRLKGKTYYSLASVIGYAKRKHYGKLQFNRETLCEMNTKITRLEEKLRIVERILDLYYEPLQLDNLALHALYKSAKERDIQKNRKSMQEWGEIFVRLNDQHFKQLSVYLNEYDCWRPFINLAYICYGISRRLGYLDLRKLLSRGIRTLKAAIVIHLRDLGVETKNLVNVGLVQKYVRAVVKKEKPKDIPEVDEDL